MHRTLPADRPDSLYFSHVLPKVGIRGSGPLLTRVLESAGMMVFGVKKPRARERAPVRILIIGSAQKMGGRAGAVRSANSRVREFHAVG